MPAAAVIPALIAYIKVVAVKKLVVGCRARAGCRLRSDGRLGSFCLRIPSLYCGGGRRPFTLKKLECSKQAYAVEYISME